MARLDDLCLTSCSTWRLLFPIQASAPRLCGKADLAFLILKLPTLSGVVEFDVGGAVDFQPAKFMERHSLGPKTKCGSVGIKRDLGVHDVEELIAVVGVG